VTERAKTVSVVILIAVLSVLGGCGEREEGPPLLHWYVFDEQSGAFEQVAQQCSEAARGRYRVELAPLPTDADQQREQLVRRLAAGDAAIDLVGMDVIWTAEFAQAGWILPWDEQRARPLRAARLPSAIESATYQQTLWAAPFTTNAQLLWYRTDRVLRLPGTWGELIDMAEQIGARGTVQAQGARYEGLTVFFVSLLASAGGSVLTPDGEQVSLAEEPTRRALAVMRLLANSSAADPALATAREDDARLAFETGGSSFMINYSYVWPSAHANAPDVAANMSWARWPSVIVGQPSRVTLGGINVGVGAHSRHPDLAFEAAACIASEPSQRVAATRGGLPPTIASLYDDPNVRERFPFADALRDTLRDAVQRPQTPRYADVSLAISDTLHPMRDINPGVDFRRLRARVSQALRAQGLQ
jgi:multiple sugar transport system substrate-binding protein